MKVRTTSGIGVLGYGGLCLGSIFCPPRSTPLASVTLCVCRCRVHRKAHRDFISKLTSKGPGVVGVWRTPLTELVWTCSSIPRYHPQLGDGTGVHSISQPIKSKATPPTPARSLRETGLSSHHDTADPDDVYWPAKVGPPSRAVSLRYTLTHTHTHAQHRKTLRK